MEDKHYYTTRFFSLIEVNGNDSLVFLNNLLTIDPATVKVNNGSRALILTPRGEVLFVLWIFKTEKSFLLLIPRLASPALTTFLNERTFLEEVTISCLDTHGNFHYHEHLPHHEDDLDTFVVNNLSDNRANQDNKFLITPIYKSNSKDQADINSYKDIQVGWRFFLRLSGAVDCLEYLPLKTNQDKNSHIYQKEISNQKLSALMLQGGNGLYLLHHIISDQESYIAKPIINAISIPNLDNFVNHNKGCYPGQEIITRSHTRGQTAVYWLLGLTPSNESAHSFLQKTIELNQATTISEPPYFVNIQKQSIKLLTTKGMVGTLFAVAGLVIPNLTSTANFALATIHRDHANEGNTISLVDSEGNPYNFIVTHGAHMKNPEDKLGLNVEKKDMNVVSFDSTMALGLAAYHQKKATNLSIAEKHFQDALKLNPEHPDPWEALAVIKEKQGEHDEAIRLNEEFAKRSTNSPLPHTNLSRLYMLKGQIERAEEEKQKSTVLMFRQAAQTKQSKKVAQSESTSAAKNSSSQSELPAEPALPQNDLGEERTRKKKMFREVLKLDPEDEIANFGLGKILFEEQSYQEAIPHLEQTIHTKPNFSLAYAFLGKALIKTSAFDLAKDVLTRGIACAKKQGEMLPLRAMEETTSELAKLEQS